MQRRGRLSDGKRRIMENVSLGEPLREAVPIPTKLVENPETRESVKLPTVRPELLLDPPNERGRRTNRARGCSLGAGHCNLRFS
jgi:hypothetical protein